MSDNRHSRESGEGFLIDPDFLGPDFTTSSVRLLQRVAAGLLDLATIAVGGSLGALARYGLLRAFPQRAGAFPWTILLINVSGSLLLGFVLSILTRARPNGRLLRLLIGTGMIGAYTTFSTYIVQIDQAALKGHVVQAALYMVTSLLLGLVAVVTGAKLAHSVLAVARDDARP